MSGIGRRLHGQPAKQTTDDMHCLDVLQLHRGGWLQLGKSGHHTWTSNGRHVGQISFQATEAGVQLSYRQRQGNDAWQSMAYLVPIEWTPCHLGGSRPWWRCPASNCGRRVRMLFGGRMFACRHCHDLARNRDRQSEEGPGPPALRRARADPGSLPQKQLASYRHHVGTRRTSEPTKANGLAPCEG